VAGPLIVLVEFVELDADLVGVGVVELLEDGQGLLPRGAGWVRVAGGVVGVTDVGEHLGFGAAIAEFPTEVEGVLVAGDGLRVVAKAVMGLAEDVPRGRLIGVVAAELLEEGEDLLVGGDGVLVFAELAVM
jgi:hypothetical protein